MRAPTTTLCALGVVGFVSARDLRRRWRRVIALALVVGAAGAVATAAAAGARRSSTALDRFKAASRAADLELQVVRPSAAQVRALAASPHVASIAVLHAYGITIPAAMDFQGIVVPADGQEGTTIDRERIVAGRAANPDAVDEVTIGEGLAARLQLHVGATVPIATMTPAQVRTILGGAADTGAPRGPSLRLRVVGIVRRPLDLGDHRASGGLMVLTPAFGRAYRDRVGVFGARIRVRTDDGAASVPVVSASARQIFGEQLLSAQGLAIESQGASDAISVLTFALWLFAGLAALVGVGAIVVLLSREVEVIEVDSSALRELGVTRVQRVVVALPATVLIAVSGGALAAAGAVALSPWSPVGVARRADPDVGVHADWTVLLAAAAVIVTVVAVIGGVAAWRSTAVAAEADWLPRSGRVSAADLVAAHGSSAPVTNGVRFALDPGRGPPEVTLRP
jgi:hypothetical protein